MKIEIWVGAKADRHKLLLCLEALAKVAEITEVRFDPWNEMGIISAMQTAGFPPERLFEERRPPRPESQVVTSAQWPKVEK